MKHYPMFFLQGDEAYNLIDLDEQDRDQFINVITKTDTRTRRQSNGQWATQIGEVIDITPVRGSCLLCRTFAKAAFNDGLFSSPLRPQSEDIVAFTTNGDAKPKGFNGPILPKDASQFRKL